MTSAAMQIGFYAPLKSPEHPVPSGDRKMARLLIQALETAGHEVELISQLRSFHGAPDGYAGLHDEANHELNRLRQRWNTGYKPDVWFSYHVYYKSPDLLGPVICRELDIPYVTAEASYAPKRDRDGWQTEQQIVRQAVTTAALNICFTERDRDGLAKLLPSTSLVLFPPFIDVAPYRQVLPDRNPARLITIAMMRNGDKLASYDMLASALERLNNRDWTLSIIGDGPKKEAVRKLFAPFEGNIEWLGQKSESEIAALLQAGGIFVWPGTGEAYGIAYLEAQAAGLPVVAQATAGVPAVVMSGKTGLLVEEGDFKAYADAIQSLLDDPKKAMALGQAARRFVHSERSLEPASIKLNELLNGLLQRREKGGNGG